MYLQRIEIRVMMWLFWFLSVFSKLLTFLKAKKKRAFSSLFSKKKLILFH